MPHGMVSGSVTSLGSIGGVTVGMVVLLVGVASHGGEQFQAVGGAIVLLGVAGLAVYLSGLDAPAEQAEKE